MTEECKFDLALQKFRDGNEYSHTFCSKSYCKNECSIKKQDPEGTLYTYNVGRLCKNIRRLPCKRELWTVDLGSIVNYHKQTSFFKKIKDFIMRAR